MVPLHDSAKASIYTLGSSSREKAMSVRRLGLVILACCVWQTSVIAQSPRSNPIPLRYVDQRFWIAPITGVNGSTIQGTCAAFVPPALTQFHLRCVNIQGGRTPTGVQLTELDQVFPERGLVNLNFSGGSTLTQDIAGVQARVTNDLLSGKLAIRFNSGSGPEGLGRFGPADEVRTLFPMMAIQGSQDRTGTCETTTTPNPPLLGIFCEHNIVGPTSFILHAGTVANRGAELHRLNFTGNSGDDMLSTVVTVDPPLINSLNTQTTNANVLNTGNWIGGNNRPCHAGSSVLCLTGHRFLVTATWRNSQGQSGVGRPATVGDDTGLFYFGNPDNWEAMVKVLNSCSLSNWYWVFASAATNAEYTLTVIDTQSNQTKTYVSPLGRPVQSVFDTEAFATCP